jgi:hypothetical protein
LDDKQADDLIKDGTAELKSEKGEKGLEMPPRDKMIRKTKTKTI